jgi:hypothetical protein
LQTGEYNFFKKYIKSLKNILNFLSLMVMSDPRTLNLTEISSPSYLSLALLPDPSSWDVVVSNSDVTLLLFFYNNNNIFLKKKLLIII